MTGWLATATVQPTTYLLEGRAILLEGWVGRDRSGDARIVGVGIVRRLVPASCGRAKRN